MPFRRWKSTGVPEYLRSGILPTGWRVLQSSDGTLHGGNRRSVHAPQRLDGRGSGLRSESLPSAVRRVLQSDHGRLYGDNAGELQLRLAWGVDKLRTESLSATDRRVLQSDHGRVYGDDAGKLQLRLAWGGDDLHPESVSAARWRNLLCPFRRERALLAPLFPDDPGGNQLREPRDTET